MAFLTQIFVDVFFSLNLFVRWTDEVLAKKLNPRFSQLLILNTSTGLLQAYCGLLPLTTRFTTR